MVDMNEVRQASQVLRNALKEDPNLYEAFVAGIEDALTDKHTVSMMIPEMAKFLADRVLGY